MICGFIAVNHPDIVFRATPYNVPCDRGQVRLVQDSEIVDRQVHRLTEAVVRDREGSTCENNSSNRTADRCRQTHSVHDLVDNFEEREFDEVRHDGGLEELLDLCDSMLGNCYSQSLP